MNKKKVVLGLSGGVDSATAAIILKEKGFEVTGLYFDVFECNEEGRKKAEKTALELDIDFVYVNVHESFEKLVVCNFCNEYISGRTPNPCIICNPLVKFKTLIDYADKTDAKYIATGHYAATYYDKNSEKYFIKKSSNAKKDQSYMLYRLPCEVIERFLMPLEGFDSKDEIRKIAYQNGISVSDAKDSQEICFIESNSNYVDFLKSRGYENKFVPGAFIDKDGNEMGKHSGIINFTVGQRKGLGMTFGKPVYVLGVDNKKNTVTLGDNNDLFNREVISAQNFFTLTGNETLPAIYENTDIYAKIRYGAKPALCRLEKADNGKVCAVFREPQRAATPGQSIVFYKNDIVIGGGFISESR